jgi:hypothetical protein
MGSIMVGTAMDITLIALFAIGLIVANIVFFLGSEKPDASTV